MPDQVRQSEARSDVRRSEAWRVPLWERLKLALSVLRGRQHWGSGAPTPWAYERVCEALRERHLQLRLLPQDESLIEDLWNAKRRADIHRALA